MARKRTGLRNRNRPGVGTYSKMRKARSADIYGKMTNGTVQSQDLIAGRGIQPLQRDAATRSSNPKVDGQLKSVFHQSKA